MVRISEWNNLKAGDKLVNRNGNEREVVEVFDGKGMNGQGKTTVKIESELSRHHEYRYLTPGRRKNFTKVIKS